MAKINVMDLNEQAKLTEAMEYIRDYINASVEYLKDKANADDAYFEAYNTMDKIAFRLDCNDIVDVCESPAAWLEP